MPLIGKGLDQPFRIASYVERLDDTPGSSEVHGQSLLD
jgi:hypothetical protein